MERNCIRIGEKNPSGWERTHQVWGRKPIRFWEKFHQVWGEKSIRFGLENPSGLGRNPSRFGVEIPSGLGFQALPRPCHTPTPTRPSRRISPLSGTIRNGFPWDAHPGLSYLEDAGSVGRPPGVEQVVLPSAHKPLPCAGNYLGSAAGHCPCHLPVPTACLTPEIWEEWENLGVPWGVLPSWDNPGAAPHFPQLGWGYGDNQSQKQGGFMAITTARVVLTE